MWFVFTFLHLAYCIEQHTVGFPFCDSVVSDVCVYHISFLICLPAKGHLGPFHTMTVVKMLSDMGKYGGADVDVFDSVTDDRVVAEALSIFLVALPSLMATQ